MEAVAWINTASRICLVLSFTFAAGLLTVALGTPGDGFGLGPGMTGFLVGSPVLCQICLRPADSQEDVILEVSRRTGDTDYGGFRSLHAIPEHVGKI